MKKHIGPIIFGLSYLAVIVILIIAASSWMINVNVSERWLDEITSNTLVPPRMLKKSWESYSFIDIIVQESREACPSEFPDEVIYEIFPGTRQACDCLEREGDRTILMDEICYVDDETYEIEEGCDNVHSIAPQIMNSINGLKYCGVRNEVSLMSMVRPVKVSSDS